MNHSCLLRCGSAALLALLLILLVPGCGDDNPASPEPAPVLSMSLDCGNGLIDLTVRNSGGPMPKSSHVVATFADGQSDTLLLSLAGHDSMTCQLSNVHGGVTVTNEEWDLEAATGDCLADYFESFLASIDLGAYVPSPVAEGNVLLCTYTIYVDNLTSGDATFEMIRTDDGLTLRYVYSNITADLAGTSPGVLCPDFTGNIAISSVVAEGYVDIGEGDDPQVTLGGCEATLNGLQVNVDGAFGFVVEWIAGWLQDNFISDIEDGIETAISSQVGSDLSGLVIVNTVCAE